MNFGPNRIEMSSATTPAMRTRIMRGDRCQRLRHHSSPTARDAFTSTQSPGSTSSSAAATAALASAAQRVTGRRSSLQVAPRELAYGDERSTPARAALLADLAVEAGRVWTELGHVAENRDRRRSPARSAR